ncbi:cytohesin-1 isoform X2 [Phymastichus coffea]|uniref:cytohesin-1 isoform X2 n=2 Tax=Phymastichus coffea TaxID=108790 RepID=UPI00273C0F7E|nr:cytohesin-1 isoform X2 [Phymastichus coffea]
MWQELDGGLGGTAAVTSSTHQVDQFPGTELSPEQQKLLIDIRRKKSELLLEIQQLKDELGEVVAEMEAMESGQQQGGPQQQQQQQPGGQAGSEAECKGSNRAKQTSIGRKKFNMDPKKGIEYLIEHGLLAASAEDVAQFLYKGEGLNKTAIGDYLGERNDFNERVLRAFVELHDFTDLILVQALRQFLWSFRLPGEAQKIDRMMECFAQRYCQLNTNIFTNTDTCYVLSFAIIMLNTSLHNPSVKDKPSVEQFINMNRGINNGGDLPRELLVSLYESIKTEPFKIPEDDGNDLMHTFFNPDKEGWLWKQGGRYKSWKRRWFILNDNCLYYFEYTTDKEPRGIIPLENIQVREVQDRNKPHCFELYAAGTEFIKACKTDSEGKVVEGKHTVYRMSAATNEEKDEWIKCVRQSISHNPFYDMLAARKKKAQKTNVHSKG